MSNDPELRYTYDERLAIFAELFPHGFDGADVLAELAPEGWEHSPLVAVFHPSPERVYEESVRMHENMEQFFASRAQAASADEGGGARPPREQPAAPDLEKIRAEHQAQPIEPERELRELVGRALWDVFSDNHEVMGADGRVVDLGSFRASGGFLAEVVNRGLGHPAGAAEEMEIARLKRMVGVNSVEKLLKSLAAAETEAEQGENRVYSYIDFYMGTQMMAGRADLSPVYRMIFARLKRAGCDWRYRFPRLLLVDLRPLHQEMKEQEQSGEPAWSEYDPSAAFAEQQVESVHDAEISETRAKLDESHREAVEAARKRPPPTTVAAYRDVFGQLPEGWPPEVDGE
ncbi:MAG: hypothetical protein WD669_04510 [Pirellulales bacterium]